MVVVGKVFGGVVWCLDLKPGGGGGALPSPLHTNHNKILISRFGGVHPLGLPTFPDS